MAMLSAGIVSCRGWGSGGVMDSFTLSPLRDDSAAITLLFPATCLLSRYSSRRSRWFLKSVLQMLLSVAALVGTTLAQQMIKSEK